MKYRYSFILLILSVLTAPLSGQVRFSDLRLSSDDILLFKANAASPSFGSYSTLFQADLSSGNMGQLTFFPEQTALINGGEKLQIQNRFGVFRSDDSLNTMRPLSTFNAFVNGTEIQTGKINTLSASPDGRYLLYLSATSHGYADLMLYHVGQEKEFLISPAVEMVLDSPNASWAPNSRFFVYQKGGYLYYFSMDQLMGDRVIDESFRALGKGGLSSIRWAGQSDLYYVTGNLVYQVLSPEFFTRSIYTGLFEVGHIAGKIPFEFDPVFDAFWISPEGSRILLNKGGQNIFLYPLSPDDYISTGDATTLPYLYLPRNSMVKKVLWSSGDIITLLTDGLVKGSDRSQLFRLNLPAGETRFSLVDIDGVENLVLSPRGEMCSLILADRVEIRNYYSFNMIQSVSYNRPLHVLWRSDSQLIIAGAHETRLYDLEERSSSLISLSQHDAAGFSPEGAIRVLTHDGSSLDRVDDAWISAGDDELVPVNVATDNYRVYVEGRTGGAYRNTVMVRDLQGLVTESLFRYPEKRYDAFPNREDPVDFTNFTHGSRIRRREVSLVFNAIDSIEGLTRVLHTLKDYGIRGTFFVNGEFMRRHPDAVREISASGHEVGSLFYAYFDMTDSRFDVDKEFIKRGLARNEDDYFKITGDELSLLWHAPYYFVNSDIIEASKEMNYTYVGRDVDPLDWITPCSSGRLAELYAPAADILERILRQKKPGSIIPVRIGKTHPEREDYLFNSLDILIDELISLGYTLVPVSELMEHAR
ncbi:polysaccharide deacetylase family protein [Marispirochaeta aestuarii]|uniref:polysaccharide deacetylase family protein n=1 Tax=Marispirochaeta aestuarii TaxID=1963862 RepID=UPI0029C8704D|nr:polysaccharide deacetylase family protein [Marispirochaeta aestuarii]